jgi:hypothetical protein
MNRVSIKGVIIGGIVDVGTSLLLGFALVICVMMRLDSANIPKDQLGAATTAAIHQNTALYVVQLLIGLGSSVLGGYVSARLAKHHELLNGVLSSLLCSVGAIYAVVSGLSARDPSASWVKTFLFVSSPACALLGGYLRLRQRHTDGEIQPASI